MDIPTLLLQIDLANFDLNSLDLSNLNLQQLTEQFGNLPIWLPIVLGMVVLILLVVNVVSMALIYEKAGKPGWGVLVPIYNQLLLLDIAGKPRWWFLLFFLIGINIIVAIIVYISVMRNFGKGALWILGAFLFPAIFHYLAGI